MVLDPFTILNWVYIASLAVASSATFLAYNLYFGDTASGSDLLHSPSAFILSVARQVFRFWEYLAMALFTYFGGLCREAGGNSKLLVFVVSFGGMVIFTFFKASLTSSLAVRKLNLDPK